jgi:hypothetical protein
MAVKVLGDNGYGDTASIIRGINFATRNGAKVINASLGITQQIDIEDDFDYLMYDSVAAFPGLFIAAAGNDGIDFGNEYHTKTYPAGFGSDTIVSEEIIVDNEIML